MNILDRIVVDKKKEVSQRKSLFPTSYWEQSPLFERPCVSMTTHLIDKGIGILAEHKRRSPSKAVINQSESVTDIVKAYTQAGAAGISVLTDSKYFGGSLDDLVLARSVTQLLCCGKNLSSMTTNWSKPKHMEQTPYCSSPRYLIAKPSKAFQKPPRVWGSKFC